MSRQTAIVEPPGLTTNRAPFIDEAQQKGETYIRQPYELYSEENHEAWRRLFARMEPRWDRYANPHFLKGIHSLCLDPLKVPRLEDVNKFLKPLTGFQARPVSGYIPAFLFFDCLRNRTFPTTITIRPSNKLDYLPEPDIFHDVAGHVPMHTDKAFAETLVRFGECAHTAAELVAGIRDEAERVHRLTSIIRAMARFFWFTVEFGLMRQDNKIKIYGSGVISSHGECTNVIEGGCEVRPFRLGEVLETPVKVDELQKVLFAIESFDQIYEAMHEAEKQVKQSA